MSGSFERPGTRNYFEVSSQRKAKSDSKHHKDMDRIEQGIRLYSYQYEPTKSKIQRNKRGIYSELFITDFFVFAVKPNKLILI